MSTQFLTEVEVAQRTHISLATLRRWRLENRGPKFRKFGSLVRYAEEELTRWEQAQPSGGAVREADDEVTAIFMEDTDVHISESCRAFQRPRQN